MKLAERYDVEAIRNRTAEEVFEAVEGLLENGSGLCPCSSCVLDLAAYALNRLAPRYSTSLLDPLHPEPESEEQRRRNLAEVLEGGLTRLRQHPHHA